MIPLHACFYVLCCCKSKVYEERRRESLKVMQETESRRAQIEEVVRWVKGNESEAVVACEVKEQQLVQMVPLLTRVQAAFAPLPRTCTAST